LQVGPESAGSVPGPACYGAGNTRPTLTDAQVVLGRINAARPLGGELTSLDVAAARAAIDAHVGAPLRLDTAAAAAAIVRVAEARMAGAIRLVSIERGHDPARFVAVPFGGGGALHVGALIREIGLKSALVPRFPGITSALGCVLADLRHDGVQTLNVMLDGVDAAALGRRMRAAGQDASAVIAAAGIAVERTDVEYELDMHYLGQTHTVPVPLRVASEDATLGVGEPMIRTAFETAYLGAFGRLLAGLPARIVSLRVAAIGRRPRFDFSVFAPDAAATLEAARRGTRQVWFDGGPRDTTIFARLDLPAGARIAGPAILEQPDATVVIEPGMCGTVDHLGNLIVEPM
jgi:N-methylhydantoinase A